MSSIESYIKSHNVKILVNKKAKDVYIYMYIFMVWG